MQEEFNFVSEYKIQGRRRKVNQACVFCQRSHMTCDSERPCQRCIKRRIGHLCHDMPGGGLEPEIFLPKLRSQRTYGPLEGPYLKYYSGNLMEEFYDFIDERVGIDDFQSPPFDILVDRLKLLCKDQTFLKDSKVRLEVVAETITRASLALKERHGERKLLCSEETLLRNIVDYERVSMAVSTPLVIFRSNGRIMRVNKTFCEIVRMPKDELEGDMRFCELLTEESVVNFCEKIVGLLLDPRQHSLITNCVLVPGGARTFKPQPPGIGKAKQVMLSGEKCHAPTSGIPCGLSATVRRDQFELPLLIALTVIPMCEV